MKHILSAMGCSLLLASGSALAATAPGSFDVNTDVSSTCVIRSANNINFGEYDATQSTAAKSIGQITFLCSNGTKGYIALDEGQNAATDSAPCNPKRRLKADNGGFLTYNINTFAGANNSKYDTTDQSGAGESARPWVPSTCDSGPQSVMGKPAFQSISSLDARSMPVHTNIPAGQDVKIGTYTDTIVVELVIL